MPRKKNSKANDSVPVAPAISESETPAAIAVSDPDQPSTTPSMQRPAYIDGPPTSAEGHPSIVTAEEPEPQEETQRSWGDPYTRYFSSTIAGFEMGENRRFKQRVFTFKERPEQPVIDTLKQNGFTYRPAEKAWTIPANPDTRKLSEELAKEFAGSDRGRER